MLITGNTCKDWVYHNKWNGNSLCAEQGDDCNGSHQPSSKHQATYAPAQTASWKIPTNTSRAGLRATTLAAHLRRELTALGWAEIEPLVRGCGRTPRWVWSGQSEPVSALTPAATCICSPKIWKWRRQCKMHEGLIESKVELLNTFY